MTGGRITRGPRTAPRTRGLTFDHRVMDGRHAARALDLMKQILTCEIAGELRR